MPDSNMFDRWAGEYDESILSSLNDFPFIGYFDVLLAIEKLVEPINGLTTLDVGIGTGLLAKRLDQLGCKIHGIDFSLKMLEKAKENIPSGEFEQVNVATDHFGKFNNHKFDRIISSYFFHHLNDQQKLFFFKNSIDNNLNDNGKIIIADIGFETMNNFNRAKIEYINEWDNDEFYLCGETIVESFSNEKIQLNYQQLSPCAGILVYPV